MSYFGRNTEFVAAKRQGRPPGTRPGGPFPYESDYLRPTAEHI